MNKLKCMTVFSMVLLGILFWGWSVQTIRAQERNIIVYNGERTDNSDYGEEENYFYVGDTGQIQIGTMFLPVESASSYTYVSSDSSVVTVDDTGRYQIVGGGDAVISVTGEELDGERFDASAVFRCCPDVSKASLSEDSLKMYLVKYNTKEIEVPFQNLPDMKYYTFTYQSSNPDMGVSCYFNLEKKVVEVNVPSAGKTVLTIQLNGHTFRLTISVSEIYINKISAVLAKKKTTRLKIKGYSGKVVWKSTKKNTVSVSRDGTVKGKKTGNAVIYTTIDGCRLGCAVSVVTPKRKKVIVAAKKIAGGTYSQAKRMSKGYYDCSSLVWRAYQKEGKSLGNKTYAPVAADICKWCLGHKRKVKGGLSGKNIQNMKLRPGDLLFETGADNGRYKGVYHVEMFIGYQCEGFDSSGKPLLGTLWAARPANYYFGGIMGRP